MSLITTSSIILYEDKEIIIVDKPSGILTVPGKKETDSITTSIKQYCSSANPIHRLDMSTSGIVLFGKTSMSIARLTNQFKEKKTKKIYIAWVFGIIKNQYGALAFPLSKDINLSAKLEAAVQKVDFVQGKKALTFFKVIKRDYKNNKTLLMLEPHTGRTHQLRVHMSYFGHEIVGDDIYSKNIIHKNYDATFTMDLNIGKFSNLQLHATMLKFIHPTTCSQVTVFSPPKFKTLDNLRLYLPK